MQTYYLSPFQYNEKVQMQVAQNKKPKEIEIRANESAIIRALSKYRVLNKKAITDAVNKMLPAARQKPNFDKEISLLFEGGYLKKYHYKDAENGRGNIVAFTLTEKGVYYAKNKQMRFAYKPLLDSQRYSTAAILEYLTLNLWHLRILECYTESIHGETYQLITRIQEDKNTIIPSCITLENEEWTLLKRFSVAAIPYVKTKDEQSKGVFLNSLLSINAFFNLNKKTHRLSFIIILVDSFQQMEETSRILYSFIPLRKLQVYYAIDEFVNDKEPLRWIYEVDRSIDNKKSVKYNLIDLTQKINDSNVDNAKEEGEKHDAGN